MTKQFKLKNDRFRKSRGGSTQLLEVICADCDAHLLFYQKDGPGTLRRFYLDRIHEAYDPLYTQHWEKASEMPKLSCGDCDVVVGIPMVYEREKRLAYRIIPGKVKKTKYSNK